MNPQEPSFILIVLLAYSLFWCFVVWLLSHFSGWQRLAQRYRTQQPASGRTWQWQSGRAGWIGYNHVLTLTTNGEGLFMEVFPLFRMGHPRLFIPWHDFRQVKQVEFFWTRRIRAEVGLPSLAILSLPAAVFEQSEGRRVLGIS